MFLNKKHISINSENNIDNLEVSCYLIDNKYSYQKTKQPLRNGVYFFVLVFTYMNILFF